MHGGFIRFVQIKVTDRMGFIPNGVIRQEQREHVLRENALQGIHRHSKELPHIPGRMENLRHVEQLPVPALIFMHRLNCTRMQ